MKKFVAWMLSLACAAAAAADQDFYLGGPEFAFVKPTVVAHACRDVWEKGPYFRNTDSKRLFTPSSDTLTIKLMQAYFPFAPESTMFLQPKSNVQIGIFADINLRDGATPIPGAGGIPGRLVFYSEDYELKQRRIDTLNTNVYGPLPYPGGGISMQVSLLEFDQSLTDKLTDSLLSGIADLGVKTAAGVPPYLQGPLTKLFQSAVQGARSRDDKFGQYTLVLDDRNDPDNPITAPLRTGYIVLTRNDKRHERIDWERHCFDPATGEVSKEDGNNGLAKAPPDFGYVVLAILKNAGADAGRVRDAFTYQQFSSELAERSSSKGIVAGIDEVAVALRARTIANELNRAVGAVAMHDGSITDEERFDAATRLAGVLHSSGLERGRQPLPESLIVKTGMCSYLASEKVTDADHSRLLMRLGRINQGALKVSDIEAVYAKPPASCNESLAQRDALRKLLIDIHTAR